MKKSFNATTIALWVVLVFSMVALNFSYSNAYYEFEKDNATYTKKHSAQAKKLTKSSSSQTSVNGYMYPDVLSSNATELEHISFDLEDSNRESIKGIKVNRIDMVQNGKTIFSSENIDSYSTLGFYNTNRSTKLIKPFANTNGDNIVDIVFYLHDKEVARINNYTIKVYSDVVVSEVWPTDGGISSTNIPTDLMIVNADDSDNIDIWLEDEDGNTITEIEDKDDSSYDSNLCELYSFVKLKFKSSKYLEDGSTYTFHVNVNGKEIPMANDSSKEFNITSDSHCSIHRGIQPDGTFDVSGINLIDNGPYTIEVEQNGAITGSLSNVNAFIDEDGYESISEDIKSAVKTIDEPYTTHLYDSTGELIDEYYYNYREKDVIEPSGSDDDTDDDVKDGLIILDKSKYKEFIPSQNIVEATKDWTVQFNKNINKDTIMNSFYVLDRNTGETIILDSFVFESLYSPVNSMTILYPNDGYISGHKYYLIIDGLKSNTGKSLAKPILMEFEIQ